jgi:hypothetical protein
MEPSFNAWKQRFAPPKAAAQQQSPLFTSAMSIKCLLGVICCAAIASASAAHPPTAAVGITFDSNNIYNWSIWQYDITTSPPTHSILADIPGYTFILLLLLYAQMLTPQALLRLRLSGPFPRRILQRRSLRLLRH